MRNVVVTGASRGLGLGVATALSAAGYRVIGVARKPSEALAALPNAAFVSFDLAEVDAIGELVRAIKVEHGALWGLVNNAGISAEGLLANMHITQIEAVIRLNTLSPIVMSKFAVRQMMASGGGRVVNISSIIASTGFNGLSVYGATKASLVGFTKSLAREVGRLNVTVNAVAPGFVDTELTGALPPEERERIVRRSALRRLAGVEDVGAAVSFLMGDGARNITGTVLTVDAGNTA